ncbi:MAG: ArsR transcriptional regulator [ANME-2 cluster archaeon HR1]|jgi:predicted DNA-binding ArsR family transcriptional regulator|nr:MAG: ArsR transcriptional regulator [ANME-2 cluster archaeon HR1]
MGKRTRIINDPSDLVPLLRTFGSQTHKKVFDYLLIDWFTEKELIDNLDFDTEESLNILKKGGLIESKWRMPEAGKTPEKEYHTSYSKIQVNFQCSIEDLSDLIEITFGAENEYREMIEQIENEVINGNQSMTGLSRAIGTSPLHLRGVARRSNNLLVKGQRIEFVGVEK